MQDCISDLDSVIAIGELLEKRIADGEFDFDLFNALVISYGRGFQSGKSRVPGKQKANLRPFVARLSTEHGQQHKAVMKIRNRRVAHSVDTGEAMVTASFTRDGSFVDLGAIHVGLGVGADEIRRTVALAKELRELAYEESDRLRVELRRDWEGRTLTSQQMKMADQNLAEYLQGIREQL